MSSCESNEFSNMDEKINQGIKQGNIPKNLVIRNSIFKSNMMKPKTKMIPKRDSIRPSKSLNPPEKSSSGKIKTHEEHKIET